VHHVGSEPRSESALTRIHLVVRSCVSSCAFRTEATNAVLVTQSSGEASDASDM
jgi:hypothetical protein